MLTPEFERVNERDKNVHKHGLTPEQMTHMYTEWAPTYDQDLLQDGIYNGPKYAADKTKELYGDKEGEIRVLDVAAGTGLLGAKLYEHGFRNIDALEPSRGMLDLCKAKKVYQNLICDFMSENTSNIKTDAYDCIVICGGMGESHIPRTALPEMIRIVKPGGYICIMMKKEYLETAKDFNNNKLDDLMDQLEASGYWLKVERTIKPHYSFKKDGVLYVYKVV